MGGARFGLAGLQRGQIEKLLHEAAGAIDAGGNLVKGVGVHLGIGTAERDLCLRF